MHGQSPGYAKGLGGLTNRFGPGAFLHFQLVLECRLIWNLLAHFVPLKTMLNAFLQHLNTKFPELLDSTILVAVSGGVDSVVLASMCYSLKLNFSIAHCNFHLRGLQSDQDEVFVRDLGECFDTKVFVQGFDTISYAKANNLSVQMAARELRYNWFEKLRNETGADYVLTGHHADDNLETFLINVLRGTGLQGLCGIPQRNGKVLRPMLHISRQEIETYAEQNQIQWREDHTNASNKYLRNKLRLDVIPILKQQNPELLKGFEQTQGYLKQSSHLLEDYTGLVFSKVAKSTRFGYSFDISKLKSFPNTKGLLYELFKSFGFKQWNDVYLLLDAQPGKMVLSGSHRLLKDREQLLLTKLPRNDDFSLEIKQGEEYVMSPYGTFHFQKADQFELTGGHEIFVDKAKLNYPLRVRKWRKGDYFFPFGMEGSKKLSKFFKDNKFSLPQKENCLVLLSQEQIVWVVGYRADSRFRVDKETTSILRITYNL